MKLEFLADDSPDGPLLRLYDFTSEEVRQLHAALMSVAFGQVEHVELHRLPFITPQGNCELASMRQTWDQGVMRVGKSAFECRLTPSEWEHLAELVESLVESSHGYQWLSRTGEVSLLLSKTGEW